MIDECEPKQVGLGQHEQAYTIVYYEKWEMKILGWRICIQRKYGRNELDDPEHYE